MPLDIITAILGLDIPRDNLHAVIGYFVNPLYYMPNKENTTERSDTQVNFGGLFILIL